MPLSADAIQVLRDLNPWWRPGAAVRPVPPSYERPVIRSLCRRMKASQGLIEIVRGPRQVGKTTGIYQIVRHLVADGKRPADVLFIRFDLEVLREERAGLRNMVRWYAEQIRGRPLDEGRPTYLFLDEIHKLPRWSEEVKHLADTFPLRILITGSSSVLVARGTRESLAGRVFTSELPPFSFREVLECWYPGTAAYLPARIRFLDAFGGGLREAEERLSKLKPQQKLSLRRVLERYYQRGGYPRLYSGEVDDDRWADYLVQTVFENVLGADIPDLFPIENPQLLRSLYLWVARHTGQEISQSKITQDLTVAGTRTNQPTVGRYLHYLRDALLIREFRRYPLAKRPSARVPSKITLTDLGVHNAILRGAPSLWESDPSVLGPLVETMVQGSIRDVNLQVHFFREHENPADRRTPMVEVDFVAERIDGTVLPIEVKFRRQIKTDATRGLNLFRKRFGGSPAILVTRDEGGWDPRERILAIPLLSFLLAF